MKITTLLITCLIAFSSCDYEKFTDKDKMYSKCYAVMIEKYGEEPGYDLMENYLEEITDDTKIVLDDSELEARWNMTIKIKTKELEEHYCSCMFDEDLKLLTALENI